ncbi:MAG: hypothetical protein V3V84_07715 [Candidatus Bathyarchaeia archaeon]
MECGFVVLNGNLEPINKTMAQEIAAEFGEGAFVSGELKLSKPARIRTITQNASIHQYCKMLANAFNNAGLDQRSVFLAMKESFFISWSMLTVKESMWRLIQKALLDIESTTKLDTKQVSHVYEHINRFTAEKFGISIPFPSMDSLANESQDK